MSFMIWYLGYWGAGDAKLFIAYTALVPANTYPLHNEYGWIYLLAGIFSVGFILLALKATIKSLKKPKETAKMLIRYAKERMPTAILGIFSISWALEGIFKLIGASPGFMLNFAATYAAYAALGYAFKDKKKYPLIIFGAIAAIRLITDFSSMNMDVLYGLLKYLILFLIIGFTVSGTQPKKARIDQLEAGMVLAETIYKDKEGYKRCQISDQHLKNREFVIDYEKNKLDENDVMKLRKLYKTKGFPFRHLRIKKMQAFAAFMFLGVMIIIIATMI